MAVKEFKLTEASFGQFNALYMAKVTRVRASRRFWPPIGAVCLVMAVLELTGIYRVSPTVDLAQMLMIFGGILVIWPFLIPAMVAGQARKSFRNQAMLHDPIAVSWTADHVEHASRAWSNRQAWSEFTGWAEGDIGFVLINGAAFSVIPRDVLTEAEVVEIRALLEKVEPLRAV